MMVQQCSPKLVHSPPAKVGHEALGKFHTLGHTSPLKAGPESEEEMPG